ncbi:unnamed protein product, partial [Rotaria magnacalcarata]
MEELLADNTKFKLVDNDPTLTNEDQLIRLLSRLKKENFITEVEYKVAKPSGSRLARLYGLPKLHEENCPLRPVMSAIKTVNYGLGKMLTSRLSHLRQSQYVIKDSSDFVTKLKNTKNVDKLMISFDVVSLFTNVPLTFTIDYILNQLYPVCSTNCLQLSKTTSKTHFSFNDKIYVQHDGVAMGAPLAPIIADISMAYLETTLMDELISLGVCEWHRYVDDTFVFINPNANVNDILSVLNGFHPSMKFTHKVEKDNELEFLEVKVIRIPERHTFETTIYRKPTFTGLMTNWNSYVPIEYKKSSITSMMDRALRICSTYQLLSTEFNEIRKIAKLNDYPTSMVDTLIGIKFSKYRNKQQQSNEPTTNNSNDNRQIIYVEIPYVEKITSELKKRTQHLVSKLRTDLNIKFFSKPPSNTNTYFQTKDPITKHMLSDVVYSVKCKDCGQLYIGKTERQCIRRLHEHGAPKTTFNIQQHVNHELDDSELRRSARLKNKAITTTTKTTTTTTTTTTATIDLDQEQTSSIKKHIIETGHNMDWSNFNVVCQ